MVLGRHLILAALAAACIGAAGVGSYLAVRADRTAVVDAQQPTALEVAEPRPTPAETPDLAPAPGVTRPDDDAKASPAAAPLARRSRVIARAPVEPTRPVPAPEPVPPTPVQVAPALAPVTDPAPTSLPAAEPEPSFDEVTISDAAVIGIRLDSSVTSETAKIEDPITARVTRDVTVDGRTVIPEGSQLTGWVTVVERGGKFRERARLGIQFTSVVLADNVRVPIETETIFREGESPTGEATAKVGASAVVGAILGSVIGGGKGAAIGSAAGAAGGSAAVLAGGRNAATIASGAPLTVRLTEPATIRVTRDRTR